MKKTTILLVSAVILISSIFIAACNETDISKIVKNLPDVQQFMQEHPDADMKIVYLSDSVVASKITDIRQQCTEDVPQVAMYYVEFKEGTNIDMKLWLDATTQQLLCALKKGINNTFVPVAINNETAATKTDEVEVINIYENTTISGVQKILGVGETTTSDVNGTQAIITLVAVNPDKSPIPIFITVNGESRQMIAGQTESIGGVWLYLKRIFPSYYTRLTERGTIEIFVGINPYVNITSERQVDVSDEEVKICSQDFDCMGVNADACGCYAGGKATSINKRYINYWNAKVPLDNNCATFMSQDTSCKSEPKCVSGSCKLVLVPVPVVSTSCIEKVLSTGNTAEVNVSGTQIVVSVININTDELTATIMINNESRPMTIGETATLGGMKVYVKQIYSYGAFSEPGAVELSIGC